METTDERLQGDGCVDSDDGQRKSVSFNNDINYEHFTAVTVDERKTSMEQCWNDMDGEKLKYSQTKAVSMSFIQHQSHVDWSEIKPTQDENVRFHHCKTQKPCIIVRYL